MNAPVFVRHQHAAQNDNLSKGDLSEATAVDLSGEASKACPVNLEQALRGRPVDLHKMRCMAPALWAEMMKAGTQGSVHAAYLLSTDEKTARNYLAGRHSPQWPVVAATLRELPKAARYAVVDYLIGAA